MDFLLSTGQAEPESTFGGGSPETGLGAVLRAFAIPCERLAASSGGSVSVALSPGALKSAARRATRRGACVHLCFAPPDACTEVAGCPTIPVFGCGLARIPTAPDGTSGLDWRAALARFGRAICLSDHTASAVAAAMGPDFAVCAVSPMVTLPSTIPARSAAGTVIGSFTFLDTAAWPAPVATPEPADDAVALRPATTEAEEEEPEAPPPWRKTLRYRLGTTRLHASEWYRDAVQDLLPAPVDRAGARATRGLVRALRRGLQRRSPDAPDTLALPGDGDAPPHAAWQTSDLALSGTVFAAVHGVWDRSWSDAISAFVFAFRDQPGATLLLRAAGIDGGTREALAAFLRRLLPFRCRVIVLDALPTQAEADALIDASAYYVCASHAEAAPLPLIGFMARGRPAIAPAHSALADFVEAGGPLCVASSAAPDHWPGDPGERLRTESHRLDWDSLCQAYTNAYRLAADQAAYARLQQAAVARLRARNEAGARALAAFVGLA